MRKTSCHHPYHTWKVLLPLASAFAFLESNQWKHSVSSIERERSKNSTWCVCNISNNGMHEVISFLDMSLKLNGFCCCDMILSVIQKKSKISKNNDWPLQRDVLMRLSFDSSEVGQCSLCRKVRQTSSRSSTRVRHCRNTSMTSSRRKLAKKLKVEQLPMDSFHHHWKENNKYRQIKTMQYSTRMPTKCGNRRNATHNKVKDADLIMDEILLTRVPNTSQFKRLLYLAGIPMSNWWYAFSASSKNSSEASCTQTLQTFFFWGRGVILLENTT